MRPCSDRHPEPIPETCHLCKLYLTNPAYRELWDNYQPPESPGFTTKVINFSKSIAQHTANGFKTVSELEYARRLGICNACEFFKDNTCTKCGCRVAGDMIAKARWASSKCPAGKWGEGS